MQPNSRIVNRKFPMRPPARVLRRMQGLGDDTAGLPAGTVLSYTATWGRFGIGTSSVSWNDPNGIQSAVQGVLNAQWGIVVDSQFHTSNDYINIRGKSGFSLLVHTTRDYGAAGDVKSIIDGELYNVGVSGLLSSIAITKQVAAPTSTITLAQAQANLAQAQADGDMAAVANWTAVVAQLGGAPPGGSSAWLSTNWPWLVAAGVGLIVVTEVL